ncbi:MAG: hypothetical protein EOP48_19965, partial [Sphingobacteriales bacterium]
MNQLSIYTSIRSVVSALIIGVALLPITDSVGQEVTRLSIGDALPNVELQRILNFDKTQINTAELKNKSILFDFGTTNCSPCMDALVILDSLQKVFKSDIQIFMVTPQKTSVVERFLKNRKGRLGIPIIVEDTLLSTYFKWRATPHEVWIDRNKRVKAYTDHHYITHKNLDSLIKGFDLNWPVKWDFERDYREPLLQFNAKLDPRSYPERILYRALFSNHMPGIQSSYAVIPDTTRRMVVVSMINLSIAEMYFRILGKTWNYSPPPSQVFLKVKDPKKVYFDASFGYKALWKNNHTYCYEGSFPAELSDQKRIQKILNDLNDYLGMQVKVEKRNVSCLLLKRLDHSTKLPSQASVNNGDISIDHFVFSMNRIFNNPPIIDETQIPKEVKSKIRLTTIPSAIMNLDSVNNVLEKDGLILVKGYRNLE